MKKLQEGGDDELGRGGEKGKARTLDDSKILTASFRGRPLLGTKVELPAGFKGKVVGKDKNDIKSFNEFYYWNWDEKPCEDDEILKALQWLKLAKAIHE